MMRPPESTGQTLDFDLTALSTTRDAKGTGVRAGYVLVAAMGAIAVVAGLGFGILRGFSALSVALFIVGMGFLVIGGFVIRLMGLTISRIRISDSSGIEFVLSNSQSKSLRWSDPSFQLELVNLAGVDSSSRARRTASTLYGIGSRRIGQSASIPEALYVALLSRCPAHGLVVRTNNISQGAYSGATQSIITRT